MPLPCGLPDGDGAGGEGGCQGSLDFESNCGCDGAAVGEHGGIGKWYRIQGEAGDSLAASDPGMYRCGALYVSLPPPFESVTFVRCCIRKLYLCTDDRCSPQAGWLTGWSGPHVTGYHWTHNGGPPGTAQPHRNGGTAPNRLAQDLTCM